MRNRYAFFNTFFLVGLLPLHIWAQEPNVENNGVDIDSTLMVTEATHSPTINKESISESMDTDPDTLQLSDPPQKSASSNSNKMENKILLIRKGKLRQFYIMQPDQIFEMRVEKPEYVSITIDPNGNQVITIPEDIESTVYYTGLSISDTAANEDDLGFEDKEVNISFSNNDRYIGMLKNGLPHGVGKIEFNNGDLYEGEFEQGVFHGEGMYFDLDADNTYYGEFKEGERQGKGRLYEGAISDSVLIYEGEYMKDLFHGEGKYYNNEKLRYIGKFSEGEFEGKGKLYENGEPIYEGQFRDGAMHGEGIKYAAQGIYEGMFREDQFHGLGVFMYENGDTLSGTFSEGEIFYGEVTYANGDLYRGELQKGVKHGKGFYTNYEGERYYGVFKNGTLVNGTCLFSDGSKYEGELENWKFHGQGKYYFPDGSYVSGIFKDGRFCEGYEYKMKKNGKLKKKNRKIENC